MNIGPLPMLRDICGDMEDQCREQLKAVAADAAEYVARRSKEAGFSCEEYQTVIADFTRDRLVSLFEFYVLGRWLDAGWKTYPGKDMGGSK